MKKYIKKTLGDNYGKDFFVEYKDFSDFSSRAVGIIGHAVCRQIKERNMEVIEEEAVRKTESKKIISYTKSDEIKARENLRNLFVSIELKYKYFYAFIDLVGPIYLDKRSEEKREKIRILFEITIEQEKSFIRRLVEDSKIDLVGSLCVIKDKKLAEELQNEIFSQEAISLESILQLFI